MPLTEAQREMWLATQMGPAASAAHNESCIVSLDGRFELTAMQQAIETVVSRHEALRAIFSPDGDYQRFASFSVLVEVAFLDLSKLESKQRDAELKDLLAEEATKILRFGERSALFISDHSHGRRSSSSGLHGAPYRVRRLVL